MHEKSRKRQQEHLKPFVDCDTRRGCTWGGTCNSKSTNNNFKHTQRSTCGFQTQACAEVQSNGRKSGIKSDVPPCPFQRLLQLPGPCSGSDPLKVRLTTQSGCSAPCWWPVQFDSHQTKSEKRNSTPLGVTAADWDDPRSGPRRMRATSLEACKCSLAKHLLSHGDIHPARQNQTSTVHGMAHRARHARHAINIALM